MDENECKQLESLFEIFEEIDGMYQLQERYDMGYIETAWFRRFKEKYELLKNIRLK